MNLLMNIVLYFHVIQLSNWLLDQNSDYTDYTVSVCGLILRTIVGLKY